MANWNTLQNNFLQGEVSPRFVANVDSEFAKNAVAEAVNAVILMQGNVTKRMGTRFFTDIEVGEGDVRLWPFYDLNNRRAISMWTNGTVRIVSSLDDAPTTLSGTPDRTALKGYEQLITNPTFVAGLTGYTSSGRYARNNVTYDARSAAGDYALLEAVARNSRPASFEQPFLRQRITIRDTTASIVVSIRAAKNLYNVPAGADVQLHYKVGYTQGGSEITTRVYSLNTQITTHSDSIIITGGIAGELFVEVTLVITGTTAGSTGVEAYRIFVEEMYLYAQTEAVTIPATLTTPYGDRDLRDLHFIQSPFNDKELIILHPQYEPYALSFNGSEYVMKQYTFIDPPPQWGENNWPSIATEYQGRLVLTGAVNDPETIWASQTFKWDTFTIPTEPTPEAPVTFTPTARGINTWLTGFKALLFGSTEFEFEVSSQSRLLSPTDVGVQRQSSYGSRRNPQKMTLGHSVVLATGGNTAVRMAKFNRDDNGFVAPDVMLKAEHLGRKIIRRTFHTRDPHDMLWCVMLDGSLSVMGFDERAEVNAWTHFITDGRFIDGVSLVDQVGRDVVVLVVERVVNGETVKYLETINNLRDVQNWQYMDSSIRTFMASDNLTVGGLEHLEAKQVDVFTDDNYMGQRTVVNGVIDIDAPANFVDVGLSYEFRVTTLPQAPLVPQVGLAAKKRYSRVGVRGVFSRPPIINGQRPPERAPGTPMGLSQPGEILLDTSITDTSWTNTAGVVIREPLPLRLTIAGIFGKLTSNQL